MGVNFTFYFYEPKEVINPRDAVYIKFVNVGCRNYAQRGNALTCYENVTTDGIIFDVETEDYSMETRTEVLKFMAKIPGIDYIEEKEWLYIEYELTAALPQIVKFIMNLFRFGIDYDESTDYLLKELEILHNKYKCELGVSCSYKFGEWDSYGERAKMILLEAYMRKAIMNGINPFVYFYKWNEGYFTYFKAMKSQRPINGLKTIKDDFINRSDCEYFEPLFKWAYNSIIGVSDEY